MGTLNAMGFAEAVDNGELSLSAALEWHLTANHYPPLPHEWVPAAHQAIEAGNARKWTTPITLPAAGPFAEQTKLASELIITMHLECFIESGDAQDDL